jgi:hypothetical protein
MNTKSAIALGMAALVLAVLGPGCASTKYTEDLLAASGFKQMPAATPEQQAHLRTLPPHKVSRVVRDGKTYFVYPNVKRQVLYVGTQAQYDAYQKLRQQNQMAQDQAEEATMNADAGWTAWGAWSGVDFTEPGPAFRR